MFPLQSGGHPYSRGDRESGFPELAKRIVDRICTIGSQRIEDAMGFQQVNLYELGTTDPDPCNRTRMLTFAFAGIVAAVVTYVIFLIIFLLDDRIKTDDENLERYLGLSVLGNIPNADGKKKPENTAITRLMRRIRPRQSRR